MAVKKVALLTAGGLAPCLSTAVGRLIERYTEVSPETEIIAYVGGYKGLLLGESIEVTPEIRKNAAVLYKHGMIAAEKFRKALSPETAKQNAWIPADSEEGRNYWDALQVIRAWTKANHDAIHDATVAAARVGDVGDRFWNEHNFVFRRGDLFFHGKGATPAWDGYADDATGLTLIPLNMSEPVLVARGRDAEKGLGFSPHGAGRNYSRSEHRRRMGATTPEAMLSAETEGLDIRFHAGGVDASELPSSYKNADSVVAQIKAYDLAEIEDYIDPYGCIMAGDVPPVWLQRKKKR